MTEHYWREDPFSMEDELNQGTAMSEVWVEGYNEMSFDEFYKNRDSRLEATLGSSR